MKLLVVGSLRDVPVYPDLCDQFVRRLGETVVEREHILLTGCSGSLDSTIAEAAHKRLKEIAEDSRRRLISYRLKNAKPAHRFGTLRISSLTDWGLTHPELNPPEQLREADAVVCVAGSDGTLAAANWARIAGKPLLGVAQFGGSGCAIYERERSRYRDRYAYAVSLQEFDKLGQDTLDMAQLAGDIIGLAEIIVCPKEVFTIMSFSREYRDVYASYKAVCEGFQFVAVRTDQIETTDRIVPQILEGIRRSAFVIADISEVSPNIFFEIGFAQGQGKPVIITAREGSRLPFDIADIPVIFWGGQEDLKEGLTKRIRMLMSRLGRQEVSEKGR